jgi:hypothetical protein
MSTGESKPPGKQKKKYSILELWLRRPWIRGFSTSISTLGYIVMFTVASGTFLMALSLASAKPEATKDVLPFATGLVGFLGGLVTAMFGATQREPEEREPEKEIPTTEES